MRDQGLSEAIKAAGGVSELARRLGISQPSVSNWNRIPAERVLEIESATGVSRMILRPDLFVATYEGGDVSEEDAARAHEYSLLAALLRAAPSQDFLSRLAQLRGDASPIGMAHLALGEAAEKTTAEKAEREYFDLFIGVGRGELLPYGSYYLTGFLHERPLARLREDLNNLGIERSTGVSDPEDHAAILCEIMAGLITRKFPSDAGTDRKFFEKHMAPWLGRFFKDLEQAQGAKFYRTVGQLGREFTEIESEAFALSA